MPITISCSTLLKRMKNAQGHHLYSFGEELDTLRKTNGAGSWSSKYDVYRLAFDNGEWGQDYNSDQAESGVVFHLLQSGAARAIPSAAKETRSCIDFAIVMADYALKYQTELFGRQLLEVAAGLAENTTRRTKNRALFDQLPDTFTFQMLQQAKPEAKYAALRMMCTLWKRNGLIRAVDVNQWQKC